MAEVFAALTVDVHVDELDRPVVQWADFTHDAGDWSIYLSPSTDSEPRVRIRFRTPEQLRDWAHGLLAEAVKMAPSAFEAPAQRLLPADAPNPRSVSDAVAEVTRHGD